MSGITDEEKKEKDRLEKNAKIAATLAKDKPNKVERLRQAFAIGANVEIACRYAGITPKTYYQWIKEDEKLGEDFAATRDHPILKSLKAVVEALDQPSYAFKYLEKKLPQEYGDRSTVVHEGSVELKSVADQEGMAEVMRVFNEGMRKLMTKTEKDKSPLQVTNKDVEPLKIKPNENIKRETTNIR